MNRFIGETLRSTRCGGEIRDVHPAHLNTEIQGVTGLNFQFPYVISRFMEMVFFALRRNAGSAKDPGRCCPLVIGSAMKLASGRQRMVGPALASIVLSPDCDSIKSIKTDAYNKSGNGCRHGTTEIGGLASDGWKKQLKINGMNSGMALAVEEGSRHGRRCAQRSAATD